MLIKSNCDSRVRKILFLIFDQILKGNVVNRASPYLHDESLEITLTVPLIPLGYSGVETHGRDQRDNKSNLK